MPYGRMFVKFVLNFMKKHGDVVDHDEAERLLAELYQEETKSKETATLLEPQAGQTDGPQVEGKEAGRGIQLTLANADGQSEEQADKKSAKK